MKKYMKPCVEFNAVNMKLNINTGSLKGVDGLDGFDGVGDEYDGTGVESKGRDGWSDNGLW